MAKFVMECPECGKYVEASTGLFAKNKIECTCGYTINVRADKLTNRKCQHCGNEVVFDQSKGASAKCPVCGEPINTAAQQDKTVHFTCAQCGIGLSASKTAVTFVCPVCEHKNDVVKQVKAAEIKKSGLASIIKYEGDADTLVWKHPIEDFNMGSQLIVHESQEAIFFRDGQALDTFPAGRYTLETQQLPVLEKLYKLPTDTEGTFHSEVYFFNLINQMAIKWGTPEKINFMEPETGAPFSIGARGIMNLRITNARKLLLKLVGTGGKLSRQDLIEDGNGHINSYFRSMVPLIVSTDLANIITGEKLDVLQLDQQKTRISEMMKAALQKHFEDYGLAISEFLIMGIQMPQAGDVGFDTMQTLMEMRKAGLEKKSYDTAADVKMHKMETDKKVEVVNRELEAEKGETEILKAGIESKTKVARATGDVEIERMKMQLELEKKAQQARIEAEEMKMKGYTQRDVMQADVQKAYADALGQMGANGGAGGGGGMLSDVAGLGVTLGAMSGVIGMTKDAMGPMMNFGGGATMANGWDCSCGTKNITSGFCPNCGSKKPEPKTGWDCSCGAQNISTGFCPNCGSKKPVADTWDCPKCGAKGITAKFCGECGSPKPEAPETWDCSCGAKGITAKFCGECGKPKPEAPETWDCPKCGAKGITAKFCGECGAPKDE